jgi:hypothetical protein
MDPKRWLRAFALGVLFIENEDFPEYPEAPRSYTLPKAPSTAAYFASTSTSIRVTLRST